VASVTKQYFLVIALTTLFAFAFRFSILEAYRVPSSTMTPSIQEGDHILIWKAPYLLNAATPERGQIILISAPDAPEHRYLRRLVGLPGDRIALTNGELWLNGERLRVDSLPSTVSLACITEKLAPWTYQACRQAPELSDLPEITVPPEQVFTMSDLRTQMADTPRSTGLIPRQAIQGTAQWIWLSIDPQSDGSAFSRLRFDRIFRKVGM